MIYKFYSIWYTNLSTNLIAALAGLQMYDFSHVFCFWIWLDCVWSCICVRRWWRWHQLNNRNHSEIKRTAVDLSEQKKGRTLNSLFLSLTFPPLTKTKRDHCHHNFFCQFDWLQITEGEGKGYDLITELIIQLMIFWKYENFVMKSKMYSLDCWTHKKEKNYRKYLVKFDKYTHNLKQQMPNSKRNKKE